MLRDRRVGGLNDDSLQRRLLAEPELTFQKAIDLAQAFEAATRNAKDLQKSASVAGGDVHVVRDKKQTASATNCNRCGGCHKPARCMQVS